MNYEYKFVEVPVKYSFKTKAGDSFENCKSIIQQEASNGWRLVQIVIPLSEKKVMYGALGYQIIFEKSVVSN